MIVSALFLIGLFLSISCYLIVRFCVSYGNGTTNSSGHRDKYMLPASDLGRRESLRLNLAYPQEGEINPIRKG